MRWLKRFAGLLAFIALLVGLGTLVPRPLLAPDDDGPRTRRILLLSNPIHTDIALPIDDDLRANFPFLEADGLPVDLPGAGYLLFGWGGRAFYLETPTWSELKLVPALKGLTADSSAMHVALAGDIVEGEDAIAFHITEARYRELLTYIQASFAANADGAPIHIPNSGYGEFDTFYEAKGTFTALLGCNTWTSAGLRAAGIQTGFWNPLPSLLRASLRLHGAPTTP